MHSPEGRDWEEVIVRKREKLSEKKWRRIENKTRQTNLKETRKLAMSDTQDPVYDSQSEIESVLQDSAGAEDEALPKTAKKKGELKPLSAQLIAKGISLLSKTGNGLSHAYTKLELHSLELTGIDILQHYPHLRYVVSLLIRVIT
jgi:hypothetical protein